MALCDEIGLENTMRSIFRPSSDRAIKHSLSDTAQIVAPYLQTQMNMLAMISLVQVLSSHAVKRCIAVRNIGIMNGIIWSLARRQRSGHIFEGVPGMVH